MCCYVHVLIVVLEMKRSLRAVLVIRPKAAQRAEAAQCVCASICLIPKGTPLSWTGRHVPREKKRALVGKPRKQIDVTLMILIWHRWASWYEN